MYLNIRIRLDCNYDGSSQVKTIMKSMESILYSFLRIPLIFQTNKWKWMGDFTLLIRYEYMYSIFTKSKNVFTCKVIQIRYVGMLFYWEYSPKKYSIKLIQLYVFFDSPKSGRFCHGFPDPVLVNCKALPLM